MSLSCDWYACVFVVSVCIDRVIEVNVCFANNNNDVRLLQLQTERYNRTNICHAGQH